MASTQWTKEQVQKAKEDFRVFLFMVWEAIGLPEPTELQYDIAHTLQNLPNDRFIIEGFRGVAKSFISCAFCVWSLWRDPQLKIEIVSASKDRADANAVFIRSIIRTLDFLEHLLPRRGQRDTQNQFDVGEAVPDISPSVKSVGITGQITGSRADILLADDVEIPNNSGTQVQRDKLGEAVKEFDAIIKPDGFIIYLGTPQNEMSLYNELLNRGYQARIWTVMYPETQSERDFYGDRLAKVIADRYDSDPELWSGKPTDPKRFNEEEIYKRRLSYGKAGFALQFMLNTNLSDVEKYPLKVSDLIVSSLDPNEASITYSWSNERMHRLADVPCVGLKGDYYHEPNSRSTDTLPYSGTVMAIDPSGRGKDETAYAVIKYLNGYLFLMEVGGYRDGYADSVLQQLANKAKYHGVNEIVIEGNFGDGMFTKLFTPVVIRTHPCTISEVKNYAQKEARIIDTLEPVMMRHKLIVNTQVIHDDFSVYEMNQQYSLFYQMTRLSRDRGSLAHDDRLDAVTMAVKYWIEQMDRDEQFGRDEIIEQQLEQWLDPDRGVMWKEDKEADTRGRFNFLKKF
ncbi:phage terminase large subunit [Veillonella intestinalis]|uniref:phage terminase large subunit n=1 Tax=Veillonella intestinalis TaxID=2941341 RepID=UPI00204201BB|nr:phage terminase large subunit [Veillonella intestinalis]